MNSPQSVVRPQPLAVERLNLKLAPQLRNDPSPEKYRPAALQASDQECLDRLLVREGSALIVLRLAAVDWIEGAGNRIKVHAGSATYVYRHSLGLLEARLDPRRFARIHRSTIVNLDRIAELRHTASGGYDLLMLDGSRLKLSRGRRRQVFVALGRTRP